MIIIAAFAVKEHMFYLRDWFITEKSKKNTEWADRSIRWIRMNMLQLISNEEAERGMSYLLGTQNMDFIKDLFQNPALMNLTNEKRLYGPLGRPTPQHSNHDEFMQKEMTGVNFRPLQILEKLFNINKAEMKKMGVVLNVRSEDPTSTEKRKKDEALIKNKEAIERELSGIYTKIGQPPVKLDHHQSRFSEEPSNGNTAAFDQMGMDANDPADVNQFMNHFYKLKEEIAAQDPIDYCMKDNEVENKTNNWMADIWAKKAVGAACHVSDVTGKPMYDYIAPETIWIYGGGRRQDYNDANAKAYQQKVSIKELLDRFGNAFDFEKDFDKLLQAITFTGTSIEWTGIKPSWQGLWSNSGNGNYRINGEKNSSVNDFMALKVTVGYVEWSSQNQEVFGDIDEDAPGTLGVNNQPPNKERYQTKARYETPTYKAFYLAVSLVDQLIFNFGEMTYQQIEGYSDFNTNFSIITWKEIGQPLSLIAAPFLDVIHEAWFKWKYEIRRAKPSGTNYNYESILGLMENLFTDQEISREARLQKVLSFLDSSANGVYTIPLGPDGRPLVNNAADLHKPMPNGLSPEVKLYWEIIIGTMDELQEVLTGKAPLRTGDPGGSRDSMNNQFKALEYSQNATYYVPEMLTYLYQQLATKTMFFVQDIIQYKNHNTLAYNYLVDAVGEDTLNSIKGLGKKAMHRYGIFVESLDQSAARNKLSTRIDFALQNGKITNAQALLVEGIKSPTKAFLWLAYFEEKTAKSAQKNAMQLQQQQQQAQMQIEQTKQQTEKIKGDYSIQVAQIQADGQKQSHIINQQGGIVKKSMEHASDVIQIEQQAQADLQKQSANIDATGKQNPPPAPQMPISPQGGPPPPQQAPLSGLQQNINAAQPGIREQG